MINLFRHMYYCHLGSMLSFLQVVSLDSSVESYVWFSKFSHA